MMSDGITINGKHSFRDFGLYISSRDISPPTKKSVRQSVPFMSGFYDFSALPGFTSWESRQLTYTFDISEWDISEMDEKRSAVLGWLASVQNTDIYDDSISGYHINGSYDGVQSVEDWAAAELTVTFVCQPLFVANSATTQTIQDTTVTINNDCRLFDVTAAATADASITIGNKTISIPAGTSVKLPDITAYGATEITAVGTVALSFVRGRF